MCRITQLENVSLVVSPRLPNKCELTDLDETVFGVPVGTCTAHLRGDWCAREVVEAPLTILMRQSPQE